MATCKIERKEPISVTTSAMIGTRFNRSGTSGNMFIDFVVSNTEYYRLIIYAGDRTDKARFALERQTYANDTWTATTVWTDKSA